MQQYLVYAWDGTDQQALERRMKARPAHFENSRRIKATGNFVLGGAMLNDEGKMIGSTMVVQFETKDQLQQLDYRTDKEIQYKFCEPHL